MPAMPVKLKRLPLVLSLVLALWTASSCAGPRGIGQNTHGGGGRTPPVRVSDPAAQGDVDLDSPVAAGTRVYYVTILPGVIVRFRIYVCSVGAPTTPSLLAEFTQKPSQLLGTESGVLYFTLGGPTLYRLDYSGDLTRVENPEVREILGVAAGYDDIVVLGQIAHGVQLFRRNGILLEPIAGTEDSAALSGRLIAAEGDRVAYVGANNQGETLRAFAAGMPMVIHRAQTLGEAAFVQQTLFFTAAAEGRHASLWRSALGNMKGDDMELSSPRGLEATGSRLHVIGQDGDGESLFAVSTLPIPDPVVYRPFSPFGAATQIRGFATYGDRILVIARHENEDTAWSGRTESNAPLTLGYYLPGQLTGARSCVSTFVDRFPCIGMLGGNDQLWIAIAQGAVLYPCLESDGGIKSERLVQTQDDLWFVASYRGRTALFLSVNTVSVPATSGHLVDGSTFMKRVTMPHGELSR